MADKGYVYYAKVRGSGQFPYDMLRYDCCFPRDEQDTGVMAGSNDLRTVKLCRITFRRGDAFAFNAGRWTSFGWEVYDVTEVR